MAEKSLFFYTAPLGYAPRAVERHFLQPHVARLLTSIRQQLTALHEWSSSAIGQVIHQEASTFQLSLADVAQPLRLAVSGDTISPPIDVTLCLLGRDETLHRLDRVLAFLQQQGSGTG
jgi:glutamyl-tRNA synthetase